MTVSRFACPHCSTQLRIRDRMFVGKIVACPDCEQQFQVVADGPRQLAARKFGTPPPEREPQADPGQPPPDLKPNRSGKRARRAETDVALPTAQESRRWRRIGAFLRNPVTVSWIVAVLATSTIVGLVLARNANRDDRSLTASDSDDDDSPDQQPAAKPAGKAAGPERNPWNAEALDANARLRSIGRLLAAYEKRHGAFPAGTVLSRNLPPEQRLSWMAMLAAESKPFGTRPPQWLRAWNDAVNEPFARQRIHLFRNPKLQPQPGADGMPVSHFVGVAGVGADGPTLPADHPRAGIFAYNRVTRRRDIRDGLENTMMVAGSRGDFGGWAVGGRGTIRSFTRTPYVNGPDGFGTGHGDRMLVLMADGSVREVSKKTAPVIVRRMAAMNDGFPLDPRIPGDPLDAPSRKRPIPKVAAKQQPVDPVRPPVAAVKPLHVRIGLPLVNVSAALAQPILRFEYTKVPLKTVLAELEEIAGVPIRLDPKLDRGADSPLNRPITIKLERMTLGAILKAVLAEGGLQFTAEKIGIRVSSRN